MSAQHSASGQACALIGTSHSKTQNARLERDGRGYLQTSATCGRDVSGAYGKGCGVQLLSVTPNPGEKSKLSIIAPFSGNVSWIVWLSPGFSQVSRHVSVP